MHPTCTRTKSPTKPPTLSPPDAPPNTNPSRSQDVVCPAAGGLEQISFEDFEENDQAETWTKGLESQAGGFSTFLGRLGRENPEISKVFKVPSDASGVILDFDFYNIDGVTVGDKAFVSVAGSYMDLGLFINDDNFQGSGKYNDIAVTKSRSNRNHIGFSFEREDQKFHVQLNIPARWFVGGELEIRFKVDLARPTEATSAGIDNVRLTAVCPAPQSDNMNINSSSNNSNRDLERKGVSGGKNIPTDPVQQPDMYAEDGGYYCSADDFPCRNANDLADGKQHVHVCHYDARRGYQTFCVPEADSDVLRFYANDYCGPCIGGYG
jgi:hypothetical protein